MFQFSRFASISYVFRYWYLSYDRWVPPFGYRWVKARSSTRQRFSQITTSFFASYRLGIHHVRLFTWPYNPKSTRPFSTSAALCSSFTQLHTDVCAFAHSFARLALAKNVLRIHKVIQFCCCTYFLLFTNINRHHNSLCSALFFPFC